MSTVKDHFIGASEEYLMAIEAVLLNLSEKLGPAPPRPTINQINRAKGTCPSGDTCDSIMVDSQIWYAISRHGVWASKEGLRLSRILGF